MNKLLKWIGIVLGGLVGLLLIGAIVLFLVSQSKINKRYEVEVAELTIPTDEASITEGERLVGMRGCADCHGEDFGGQEMINDPALAVIFSANLTQGEGGLGPSWGPRDFDRAIRHGIDPEGKALIIMPSTDYNVLSDEDLAMMIAYFQSVDPVDNEHPEPSVGPLGRALVALGQLPFAADLIDHTVVPAASVSREVSAAYGEYLAAVCTGCHQPDFAGGAVPGSGPDDPPSSNLTPAGNLANWSQEDFINTLRTGTTPEGKDLDPSQMPWPIASYYTDDELTAIWLFLSSLDPVESES